MYNNTSNVFFSISPKGAVECGKELFVQLYIPNSYGFVENVQMLFNRQYESTYKAVSLEYVSTQDGVSCYQAKFTLDRVGIHYFCFSLLLNGNQTYIKLDRREIKLCITNQNMGYFSITVYEQGFDCPDWAKGAIMYHIFVDRYRRNPKCIMNPMPNRVIHKNWNELPVWESSDGEVRNNDFFGGNIRGIIDTLCYIKKLGVTILYLSPIMRSQSNHRYDTADYEQVDPYAGCNEDLKELCEKAHRMGMKVILDAVFNHTGNDSWYFNEYHTFDIVGAFDGPQSPYYDWYKRNKDGFEYWWGFRNLPVCNPETLEWQQYICGIGGVIDQWFTLGIDGLRLDVADELPEFFLENIKIAVKRNKKDGFLLGEVWENAITKQKDGRERTYLLGKSLDSAMNYPFANAILKYVRFGDSDYFSYVVNQILTMYPPSAYQSMTNALSTHDILRAITTLAGEGIQHNQYEWTWDIGEELSKNWRWRLLYDRLTREQYRKGKKLLKLAVLLQYFLPGTPCVFYGDEVGMQGYKDPFNRKTYPWKRRDKELLKFYREVGTLRSKMSFLKSADFELTEANFNIILFQRTQGNQKMAVAINRTEDFVFLPEEFSNWKLVYSLENSNTDFLQPYGGVILQEI